MAQLVLDLFGGFRALSDRGVRYSAARSKPMSVGQSAMSIAALALVASCTTMQNTPQQERVWAAARVCDPLFRDWRLDRVDPDGTYHVRAVTANMIGGDWGQYVECMNAQFRSLAESERPRVKANDEPTVGLKSAAQTTDQVSLDAPEPRHQEYATAVLEKIRSKWIYPPEAVKARVEGTAGLLLEIAKDGTLVDVRLATSAGSELLDGAAIAAVRSSAPFPPVPDSVAKGALQINGSFRYQITDGAHPKDP